MMKTKLELARGSAEAPVFVSDKDVAEKIRAHINELASMIQDAKERDLIVSFNIGDDNRARTAVLAFDVKKKIL